MFLKYAALIALMGLLGSLPAFAQESAPGPATIKPDAVVTQGADQLLVVLVYDETCTHACIVVRPLVRDLVQRRGDKLKYVELNTSKKTLKESTQVAESLGIKTFLADGMDLVPVLAIFNAKHKKLKDLQGQKEKDVYVSAIEKCLARTGGK